MSDQVKLQADTLAPTGAGGGGPLYLTVKSMEGMKLIKLQVNRDQLLVLLNSGYYSQTCVHGTIDARLVS